jgi:two-component system chemotaxis sensor kinase CheA
VNEFVDQFLLEGRELVAQANDDLLALEETPGDRDRLDGAFRAFHTLKGAAGIVDFAAMARALHAAEDILSAARAGSAVVSRSLVDACLATLDTVGLWLDRMQATGEVPEGADEEAEALIARFSGVAGAAPLPRTASTAGQQRSADGPQPGSAGRLILEAQKALLAEPASEGAAGRMASAGRVAANVIRHYGQSLDVNDLEFRLQGGLAAGDATAVAQAIDAIIDGLTPRPAAATDAQAPETTLRVDVESIDALVRLTGELLVAKNAVGHSARLAREGSTAALASALRDQHLRLDRLVSDLQRAVLALRVMPLQTVFQRFPRLVREMTASLGKPARLLVEGAATKADKTIVESIGEPLLHVLRNALDHGVEGADERAALGKPAVATIHLRASRQGERVVIEVEDDGRGIDVARVRDVARRREVVPLAVLEAMSDEEAIGLIFSPGFSTAAEVTALSGRGVGMDVVRIAIERLGGTVSIGSAPGRGTRVRFELPFTVVMSRVLVVQVAGQHFGIPFEAVVETLRVTRERVVPVGAARAVVVRDRTLPLIDLATALGRGELRPGGEATIVVVEVGEQLGGLEVDLLGERMDVMLKPPEGLMAGVPGIEGTTRLGDGQVLLVLDLAELFD